MRVHLFHSIHFDTVVSPSVVAILHLSEPVPGFVAVHVGSPEILPGTPDEMAPSFMSVSSCVFPVVRSQNVRCEKGLLMLYNFQKVCFAKASKKRILG